MATLLQKNKLTKNFSFQELLAEAGGDLFLQEQYSKQHLLGRGLPGRFEPLFSWSDLNHILESHRLQSPWLRLSKNGKIIDESTYLAKLPLRGDQSYRELNQVALYKQLRDGASLILDGVDEIHPPLREWANQMSWALGVRVQINLYASWRPTPGFNVHWDDHDVFVLQVAGSKRWRLFGQTREAPMFTDIASPAPPTNEPREILLESGDWLYVPRGEWHDAASTGQPSLHLTCGMTNPTGIDLLQWLVNQLREEDFLRRDLPRFHPQEVRDHYMEELGKIVARRLAQPEFLADFSRHASEHIRARPAVSLPHAVLEQPLDTLSGLHVQILTSSPPVIQIREEQVVIRSAGRQWSFAAVAAPIINLLADGQIHEGEEIRDISGLDEDVVKAFLGELMLSGLIQAQPTIQPQN